MSEQSPNKAILITLSERTDRRDASLALLGAQSWLPQVDVFQAADGPRGWQGCMESHLQVYAENRERESILVFEDDVKTEGDIGPQFEQCLSELPSDYDIMFLGYQLPNPPQRFSEHLVKARLVWRTHAYMVSRQGMGKLLAADMSKSGISFGIGAMSMRGEIACYCCVPKLAGIRPGCGSDVKPR